MSEETVKRVSEAIVAFMENTTLRYRIVPWTLIILLVFFVGNSSLIGTGTGILKTSSEASNSTLSTPPNEFELWVGGAGETLYTDVPNTVGTKMSDYLLSTVFSDPEEATEAATGLEVSGNAAWAHAVKVCTHRDGVTSHNTGVSRHVTNFRFHENGRHYTRTYHQLLQAGYPVTDTFSYSVSRRYCGC